jgi:hypothetical protein
MEAASPPPGFAGDSNTEANWADINLIEETKK